MPSSLSKDHICPIDELYKRFGTDPVKGLTAAEAEAKLVRNGKNKLTPPKAKPKWLLFIINLFGGFNLLLWIGAGASEVSYIIERFQKPNDFKNDNLYLGIILAFVVTITGIFQYFQEMKSSDIMKGFNEMASPMAHVIRDGHVQEIKCEDIVIGEIVEINGGDKVPADMRIIESRGLKVDNSTLTGENEPVSKSPEKTSDNPLETKNLMFFGTNVVEGNGKGLVFLTGDHTYMGKLAGLTMNVTSGKTPIRKEMDNFIKIIGCVAVGIGVIFFAIALIYQYNFLEALLFLIGIIVANVPEGI
uniref:Cation-transporting P-type ATPase N-terminal domain-containing protein n=1 Tax=Panagrolaimus sp. JU765 TaxID=591449 RepID=A0AC34PW81_9BILA